jgi:hypothetical protein
MIFSRAADAMLELVVLATDDIDPALRQQSGDNLAGVGYPIPSRLRQPSRCSQDLLDCRGKKGAPF